MRRPLLRPYDASLVRSVLPEGTRAAIGADVADHFFKSLDPIERELRIGGVPYEVIGIIEKQRSVFGVSLDRLAIAPFTSSLGR